MHPLSLPQLTEEHISIHGTLIHQTINCLPANERAEYCIADSTLKNRMELYHEVLTKCLNFYLTCMD